LHWHHNDRISFRFEFCIFVIRYCGVDDKLRHTVAEIVKQLRFVES